MNGPLGAYASSGKMRGLGVLRSHGGRWQAIQDGEVHIDVAIIAAPTADSFGNCTGDRGPSACGLLGFALAFTLSALILNYILYQSKIVPRWISVWGFLGALLLWVYYLLQPLGNAFVGLIQVPLAIQEMVFAVWLIVKGFDTSAMDLKEG